MAEYGWKPELGISLLEKMRADLKTAVLGRDPAARDAIRQVMSEFPKLTVPLTLESGKKSFRCKREDEITNDDILGLIQGLVKSEKLVLEIKKEASSPFLTVLSTYLPRLASREEIEAWIGANVDFSKLKAPVQAMGPVMKHFGKAADGALVKEILEGRQKGLA
ncbi:MAG: GatB/YqeY domain-containing protein [Desulfobacteraceae bacterium]|nr:GatB/YqeY domain-containing protein [Desulfobacteraceae bacterium]